MQIDGGDLPVRLLFNPSKLVVKLPLEARFLVRQRALVRKHDAQMERKRVDHHVGDNVGDLIESVLFLRLQRIDRFTD